MLIVTTKHQLDQLIEGVKRANGWSDPRLVKNAKERGHVLSKSNISRMRGDLVSVKANIIFALAAGLRVSPAQVAVAAIQSMGIALPEYELTTPEQAIRLDVTLAERDKAVLLSLLRELRDQAQSSTPAAGNQGEINLAGHANGDNRRPTTADDFSPRPRNAIEDGQDGEALG